MAKEPRVALALGAGGFYGYAHIGVLQVLEEQGLRPDFVVGCSIGAVIGALYGAGIGAGQLAMLGTRLRRSHWLDLKMTRMGVVSGQRLYGVLRLLTRDRCLQALDPPLATIATDIERGERVVFTRGSAARAAQASSAMPGIFSPVRSGDRLLVDGALMERVPVQAARELGAGRILAVSLGLPSNDEKRPVRNLFDVLFQSFDIMQREVGRAGLQSADVLIEPPVQSGLSASSPSGAEALIAAGRQAAQARLDEIKDLFAKGEVLRHG